MHQVARPCPLIALDGRGRLELPQACQAAPPQPARDRTGTELQGCGDLGARPPLAAQALDPLHEQARRGGGAAMRAARAIAQPGLGLDLVAGNPLAHRALTHADGRGDSRGPLPAGQDSTHNVCSTAGGAACILMNVHPGLLQLR
jgi:hypothetical protein